MKNVTRFFQAGVALAIVACAILAKAHDVPEYKIALASACIVYAAWKLTNLAPAKRRAEVVETKLDKYYYITLYHNRIISMEELDAALTRLEVEEAKAGAAAALKQNSIDARHKDGL